MFIILGITLLVLLLCALMVSSFITRLYLQNKRKNDPSFDEFEDEENREAGLPIVIPSKYAEAGLPIFACTFAICVIGIGCVLVAYYGITTAMFLLTSLFSIKKVVAVAIFLLISYAIATTYFKKPKDSKLKVKENENTVNIWSLFKIKFADVVSRTGQNKNEKQPKGTSKDEMYLEDAMAFYQTLGYFWIVLLVLLVIV